MLQPYTGDYGADPTLPRSVRVWELRALLQRANGADILVALYKATFGIPEGDDASVAGLFLPQMVEDILAAEYPSR